MNAYFEVDAEKTRCGLAMIWRESIKLSLRSFSKNRIEWTWTPIVKKINGLPIFAITLEICFATWGMTYLNNRFAYEISMRFYEVMRNRGLRGENRKWRGLNRPWIFVV